MDVFAIVLAVCVMLVGIAGSVLPLLPGVPLLFLAVIGYGWYEGFNVITVHYVVIVGALTLLAVLVDYLAGVLGAQKSGSSRAGVVGAALGVIAGLFLGPLGILLGPLAGAFIGEYLVVQDINMAIKASIGTIIGMISGIAFKVVLGVGILISFLIIVF
ncbi:MAG: DUF456 domain-containing protein [Syntrophomonadaceae bacterium]|nr:DUF456 domain-containing protein [Syntrophomonadaceae bacterium]